MVQDSQSCSGSFGSLVEESFPDSSIGHNSASWPWRRLYSWKHEPDTSMIDFQFLFEKYVLRKILKRIHADGYVWTYPQDGMHIRHLEDFFSPFILHHGNEFVDVGANVGAWSIRASPYYRNVYAFEPNTQCFDALRQNLSLNKILNVHAFNVGLGDHEGVSKERIYNPLRVCGRMERGDCQVVKLDTLHIHPSVIKIDVEGSAQKVLDGAYHTIRDNTPILAVEIHTSQEMKAASSVNGYHWTTFYRPMDERHDWLYRENGKQVFLIGQSP